jgi:hypothetical protein
MDEKSAHSNEHLQNSISPISFGQSRKKLPIAVCVSLVILLIVGSLYVNPALRTVHLYMNENDQIV